MTVREFPRPWLERRRTPGPHLIAIVIAALVIVAAVLVLADSTAEYVPAPTVTVGTAGEATPFEVEP